MPTACTPINRMTDQQRRGRRDLVILLVFVSAILLPGPIEKIWDAGMSLGAISGVGTLVVLGASWVRLWRGDAKAKWFLVVCQGLLGVLLIVMGASAAAGKDVLSAHALAVYERIGFHPLVALFGLAAVSLVGAAALASSSAIKSFMNFQQAERNRVKSLSRRQESEEASVPFS